MREPDSQCYFDLFELSPESCLLTDENGLITEVNRAACALLGIEKRGAQGQSLISSAVGEDQEVLLRAIEHVKSTKDSTALEVRLKPARGDIFHAAVNITLMNSCCDLNGACLRWSIQDITAQKRIERQIRQFTRQLIKGQERERQNIFYHLHDGIGQELSVVKIWVDTLADSLQETLCGYGDKVEKISKKLQETIMAVRNIAYTLKPATLDQLGLVQTIADYCEAFTTGTGVRVKFYAIGMDELKMDFDMNITLYRLVQECLENVKRHAGASEVTVKLVASYPNIILDIADNGKGFDISSRLVSASKEKCTGIAGMEERVALIEGSMKIKSFPMQGTVVRFEVPWKER